MTDKQAAAAHYAAQVRMAEAEARVREVLAKHAPAQEPTFDWREAARGAAPWLLIAAACLIRFGI
jgi:hypothetical protein